MANARLSAIATSIPVPRVPASEPVHKRLWHALAHWHDLVFGPAGDARYDLYSLLFKRPAALGALAFLVLTAALPSQGAGVPLCLFRYLTGLPCPGCGLTRSFSCILHGDFERGYDYHPFGYVLLPIFLLVASTLLLPASNRSRMESFFRTHQPRLKLVYLTLIYGFIAFGVLRTVLYAVEGLRAL